VARTPEVLRRPLYIRLRARVPGVLYLNFLADQGYAERLAPDVFRPTPLAINGGKTLFTILLFQLRGGRPAWTPSLFGRLAPNVWQSNWRFYGTLTSLPGAARPGVLFWRTVTDSLWLTAFGLRIARCFPLRRVRRMEVRRHGKDIRAFVGNGAERQLSFQGRLTESAEVPTPFRASFGRFADYARWIVDQHLSLTVWDRDVVVQDMHLNLDAAHFIAVEPQAVSIPALRDFVEDAGRPLSCFWGEDLEVWLDSIRAVPRSLVPRGPLG
jgi:hypothetical protein